MLSKHYQQLFVVEKRTPDGKLDFSSPPSPHAGYVTEDELCRYYFRHAPQTAENSYSVGLDVVYRWYNAQGFYIRNKTW